MRLTSWFGFPRKPWEELDKIITSRKTKQTWESGEMEVIDPYSSNPKSFFRRPLVKQGVVRYIGIGRDKSLEESNECHYVWTDQTAERNQKAAW